MEKLPCLLLHHLSKRLSCETGWRLEFCRWDCSDFRLDDLDRSAAAASVHRPDWIALARELPGWIVSREPVSSPGRVAGGQLGHLG